MARGATILKARLELSLVDRGVYASVETTLAQHPSETRERACVRLLAFGLCHSPALGFGRGVSSTDEPDLWLRELDGRIRHWIEVGQPAGKRLTQATRKADRVTVFAFGNGVASWRSRELDPVGTPGGLGVVRLSDAFVEALGAGDGRQLRWSITHAGGVVYVATEPDGAPLEVTPECWLGDPLG